tara:strand:- start:536 stop:967 length:432 start_codon:yes stop_codon:yes gene_type:complete
LDKKDQNIIKLNETEEKMVETIEEEKNSENNDISTEREQNLDSGRDLRGRFSAGNSFSKGRPKKEQTLVEKFRSNPKALDLLQNIFDIASTLGKKGQHKDAMNCTKLIVERIVPSLKSSDLQIRSNDDSGFVYLPPQKEVESE